MLSAILYVLLFQAIVSKFDKQKIVTCYTFGGHTNIAGGPDPPPPFWEIQNDLWVCTGCDVTEQQI